MDWILRGEGQGRIINVHFKIIPTVKLSRD